MTPRWDGRPPPAWPAPGLAGWLRIALKVPLLLVLNFGGLALLLLLRLIEAPLCAPRRPVTPWITVAVCRASLAIIGIRRITRGQPMAAHGAGVANHVSWLDIYALNAGHPLYFVAKAEVAGWPGIGWLARATGTVFIRRDRREAGTQVTTLAERLRAGHRLVFFPEGTSTDGRRVLPFRTTLFAAFMGDAMPPGLQVQPVSLIWAAPPGQVLHFFGWWGDMDFAGSLLNCLAHGGGGAVTLVYHPPEPATGDRKHLSRRLEQAVRSGLETAIGPPQGN
jgi:1-acyl-sn-glycerol-3-phosphate acyltransferase